MKMLKISNNGLIEIGALTLLGASTKKGSGKIGMFGSGNKYAIACFLRNSIGLKIYSGNNEIKITTTIKEFANNKFNVICVNGVETSITTETGMQWKVWQAIREIYCNAVDEGGESISIVEEIVAESDKTSFYIDLTDDVLNIYDNIKDYFAINKNVVFENDIGQILEKHGVKTCVYRKGIKVYETSLKSLYDYNIFNLTISEDRINKYSWEPSEKIHKLLLSCTNKSVVRKYLSTSNNREYIEGRFEDTYIEHFDPSQEFREVLGNTVVFNKEYGGYLNESEKANTTLLESKLYNHLSSTCKDILNVPKSVYSPQDKACYVSHTKTPLQESMLKEVLKFFGECKYKINYEIETVSFFDKNIHGSIDNERKVILISDNAFSKGKHWIASTVIEEQCHLAEQVNDESRSMQNALIDIFITYLKERNAYNF